VSAVRVVAPAFYALGDIRTPLRAAGGAFAANAVVCLALLGPLPSAPGSALASLLGGAAAALAVAPLGHVGLALAASLAAWVNAALLLGPIAARLDGFPLRTVGASLVRSALASVPMAGVVLMLRDGVAWTASGEPWAKLALLAAMIVAGGGAFGVAALVLGGPEIRALRGALARRLA